MIATSVPLSPTLDHPAYHTPVRVRGFNTKITVFRACLPRDGGRVLSMANPAWSKEEHIELAEKHYSESERLELLHTHLLDQAHFQTFGRKREIHDYRISAIGREEYPEELKTQLRKAAHGSSYHKQLSWAHRAAGHCRRRFAS